MNVAVKTRRSDADEEPDSVQVPVRAVAGPADLYDSHFGFVWRNLRRLGVPPHSLEDAAQDVYLTVHRRWDSYEPSRSSVQSWLFGIVLRVARGHRRTFRRRLANLLPFGDRPEEAGMAPSAESPAELVSRRESIALLDRILNSLDEDRRTVLLLVDVEEVPVPEAAEILGVNLNTFYWRLRTARQDFRRTVERIRLAESRKLGGVKR